MHFTLDSSKSGVSGIDTVGDIRVPAACCGVLGFRASHGAISMAGIIPVASSCDALGELLNDSLVSPFLDWATWTLSCSVLALKGILKYRASLLFCTMLLVILMYCRVVWLLHCVSM